VLLPAVDVGRSVSAARPGERHRCPARGRRPVPRGRARGGRTTRDEFGVARRSYRGARRHRRSASTACA